MFERPTGSVAVAAINEADDIELRNDCITRARDVEEGRRSRSDLADVHWWSRSDFDIRIGQQSSTVKGGEYIHTLITDPIDEAVVALENFANFFASELTNDLAGEREGTQTFYGLPQAANVGRRSLWSISCDEISDRAQVLARLPRPIDSS